MIPYGDGEVWSAHMSYAGEDRFDITRKSGGAAGAPFAPPEDAFLEAIRRRKALEQRRLVPKSGASATDAVRAAWEAYREAYREAMRRSFLAHKSAWLELLTKPEVTLVCYCAVPTRCHRIVLAAEILPKLGKTYRGERGDQ